MEKLIIEKLLSNNISNKLYLLGFVTAFISYSFWQPIEGLLKFGEENQGAVFYIGIAFSFCCYTSAYMFTKWNKWRFFPMFAFLVCLSRLSKEVYFLIYPTNDVTKYDVFDYISFLLTVFIMFNYYVKFRIEQKKPPIKK